MTAAGIVGPRELEIPAEPGVRLRARLALPDAVSGIVVFAQATGACDDALAGALARSGLGTLRLSLAPPDDDDAEPRRIARQDRADVELLARRLMSARAWIGAADATLPVGYVGEGVGAAAALVAAARRPDGVRAIVSHSGRPDLAGTELARVHAATLLVVAGADRELAARNERALERLLAHAQLEVVEDATRRFVEPGILDRVATISARWLAQALQPEVAVEPHAPM